MGEEDANSTPGRVCTFPHNLLILLALFAFDMRVWAAFGAFLRVFVAFPFNPWPAPGGITL